MLMLAIITIGILSPLQKDWAINTHGPTEQVPRGH
jgi:hypothetical protein